MLDSVPSTSLSESPPPRERSSSLPGRFIRAPPATAFRTAGPHGGRAITLLRQRNPNPEGPAGAACPPQDDRSRIPSGARGRKTSFKTRQSVLCPQGRGAFVDRCRDARRKEAGHLRRRLPLPYLERRQRELAATRPRQGLDQLLLRLHESAQPERIRVVLGHVCVLWRREGPPRCLRRRACRHGDFRTTDVDVRSEEHTSELQS